MDLDEPFRVEVFAEELANSGLDAENGLVGRGLCLGLSREWLVYDTAPGGVSGHWDDLLANPSLGYQVS